MNIYVKFILKWPKLTILFFLLITIVMGAGIPKLGFNNSIESFMPHRDKEYLLYNKIKDTYGNPDNFHIFSVTHPRLWSTEAFAKLNELLVDIEAYQDFDEKLENRRLETLNTVISKGPVSPYVLIDQFNHDPVFKKLLSRKIESMFKSKKMLSERNLNKLKDKIKLSYDLKKNESVDTIISPFTIKDITGKNDVLEIFDLIEFDENGKRVLPQTERELSEFRKRLMRNPAFDKGIYSKHPETGEITDFGVIVMFKNMADYDPIEREMCELAKSYDTLTITSFGAPYVVMVNNDYVQRDLIMLLPLVLITVILVFYYNFKSVRGVILPFSAICMTIIWTLGLIGHLGFKLTLLGNIIPSLMVAVGSSYSIHIINQYYADFDLITRKGLREGLRISMGHISVTVLLAGLTTCIAFITLTSSQISAVKEWGFFSAVGVLSAVFISVSLIPAILSLMIHKRPQRLLNKSNALKTTISDRILYIFTIGATRHYKKVLSVLSILILISFVGIFYLNVETQFMMNFRENSEIRTNEKIISKKFGGGNNFSILVDTGKENGVLTPDFLNTIENFRAWLVLDENIDLNIGRTDAFGDFLKTMHMAMNNDDMSYYKIPDNPIDILDYLELYSGDDDDSDGRIDDFEPFVNSDFSAYHFTARLGPKSDYDVGTKIMRRIMDAMSVKLSEILPPNCTFSISGQPLMMTKFSEYVIMGQLMSLGLSLCVVGMVVFFLFSNLTSGVLALIPMSTAVIINFGIMGLFKINLDAATSIIAAITIGVGVDDTIHFLNTYKYYINRGHSIDETIEKTLAVSGKAILFTSFALIFGFSVMSFSPFLPISLFGILMVITMVATTVSALLVLPSVIKATRADLRDSIEIRGIRKYLNLARMLGLES